MARSTATSTAWTIAVSSSIWRRGRWPESSGPTTTRRACGSPARPRTSRPLLSAGADRPAALTASIAAAAPELGARLRRTRWASPIRGAINLPNVIRQPYGPGWALVGDAGYHRDPITGHGITDAFRDAELLARAVHQSLSGERDETSALSGYAFARNKAIGEIFGLTKALAAFPGVARFVELQKRLSDAIEREALTLAAQPQPGPHPHRHPAEVQLMS